jgi:phosphoribosylpyrophosphate synthetase
MIDAAKRASARHITAVIPYFGWSLKARIEKSKPEFDRTVNSQINRNGWCY